MSKEIQTLQLFIIRTLQVQQQIDNYKITPIHIHFAHGHR